MTLSNSIHNIECYKSVLCRFIAFILIGISCGCSSVNSIPFEPNIAYYPSPRIVETLASPFPFLTQEEKETEWGRELYMGLCFVREFDLYRGITCYKRALFTCPQDRIFEIEYHLIEAYYLGRKYSEAIEIFETGCLDQISLESPGNRELLLILFDSYRKMENFQKAERLQLLIDSIEPEMGSELKEYAAIMDADFCALENMQEYDPTLPSFVDTYASLSKSVKKAEFLNAILPGAGYYYVGQKKTAVTAFIVNALFTWAAYEFYNRGYIAAGVITTSLEMGWYFGGINGAGLAANEFNEHLYTLQSKEFMIKRRLFPLLMFNYAF